MLLIFLLPGSCPRAPHTPNPSYIDFLCASGASVLYHCPRATVVLARGRVVPVDFLNEVSVKLFRSQGTSGMVRQNKALLTCISFKVCQSYLILT